jgi:hypothetical protein
LVKLNTSKKPARAGRRGATSLVRERIRSSSSRFRLTKIRVPLQPSKNICVILNHSTEEMRMNKALAVLAVVATVAATTVTAPAQARGWGPGLGFGLAAGALAAGAIGAYGYYGPGYGYYGPRYYGYYGPRYYAAGPYGYYGGYYGGPYWRHRYWRPYW